MSISERAFFFQTAVVDGNTELDYLTSQLNDMTLQPADFYRIDEVTAHRPDLISFRFYGNYNFGWLIAEFNGLLDPVADLYRGRVIKIPALDEYYQFYNRATRSG